MGQWDEVAADVKEAIFANGRLCRLIVTTQATPADATKPWNVGAGTPVYYPSAEGGIFSVSDVQMSTRESKTLAGYPAKNCIIPGDVGIDVDLNMTVELMDGEGAGVYTLETMNSYVPDGVTRLGWKVRLVAWQGT